MKIKTSKGKKLFYKKYLYKIEFTFVLSKLFRSNYKKNNYATLVRELNQMKNQKSKKEKIKFQVSWFSSVIVNEDTINDGLNLRKLLINDVNEDTIDDGLNLRKSLINDDNDYKVRVENTTISIYTNDPEPVIEFLENSKTISQAMIWEPDKLLITTQDPDILISNFANEYDFKIHINMGRLRQKNPTIIEWIRSNRDKFKITDYSLDHAYSICGVYVRDQKVLTLLQMTDVESLGSISKLVLPS